MIDQSTNVTTSPMSDLISTDQFTERFYPELRLIAASKMAAERPDHTLQVTALVHEVFCRLRSQGEALNWSGPDHFLAAATETMRRILVDHARHKLAKKNGGNWNRVLLDEFEIELPMDAANLLAVHDALDALCEEDPLAGELVKLRVFAGMSHLAVAQQLEISRGCADRVWAYSKARLYTLMADDSEQSDAQTN